MLLLIKKTLFLIILITYSFSAINSNGFHHPDEHFQIIEFAGLKEGWNTKSDLAWEYNAKIRPILQPLIALAIIKLFHLVEINDPFIQSMGLRILSATLSIACILFFIKSFSPSIQQKYRVFFVIISFFLWFLPAINVRFSSETWAGLALLCGIALIYSTDKWTYHRSFIIGILMGLSFEFRFQMGIVIVSLLLWMWIIKRISIKLLISISSGVFFLIVLCTFIDSWYYDKLIFVPYNYFEVNILHNIASTFGVSPWHFYLIQLLTRPTPLIGTIILLSIIILGITNYKNIILWCILPFLLIHSFIPHKEVRFLFPIVNLFPIIIIWAYQWIEPKLKTNFSQTISYSLIISILIVNIGGLVMSISKPASNGAINLAQYIKREYSAGAHLFCHLNDSPFSVGNKKGLIARFYKPKNIIMEEITPDFSVYISSIDTNKRNKTIIVIPRKSNQESYTLKKEGFTLKKQSIPKWLEYMNKFYLVYDDKRTLMLYSHPS